MRKVILIALLILATIAVCASVFEAEPKDKPRKLTPAEQRESLGPKRIGKG